MSDIVKSIPLSASELTLFGFQYPLKRSTTWSLLSFNLIHYILNNEVNQLLQKLLRCPPPNSKLFLRNIFNEGNMTVQWPDITLSFTPD